MKSDLLKYLERKDAFLKAMRNSSDSEGFYEGVKWVIEYFYLNDIFKKIEEFWK